MYQNRVKNNFKESIKNKIIQKWMFSLLSILKVRQNKILSKLNYELRLNIKPNFLKNVIKFVLLVISM